MTTDIFIPQSKPEDALVGPLNTITYVTSDEDAVSKIFIDGLGMTSSSWYAPVGEEKSVLDAYLGFKESDEWKTCRFYREDEANNIQVRVISVDDQKPLVRPELHGNYLGGATVGFPMSNTTDREKQMTSIGFPSSVGVKRLEFSSPTGETYVSEEVHFPAPENVYVLGVKRPDIFVQVGPVDEVSQIGGPAYSALCIPDSEAAISFYRDVLGYEIRRDMATTVGPRSGLGQEEGSAERFMQAFAPGSSTGYLVFLDHEKDKIECEPSPYLGPISRGISMWSFATRDIAEVHRRAVEANATIVHSPQIIESPFLPKTETMLLRDPGGYPIEIYAV